MVDLKDLCQTVSTHHHHWHYLLQTIGWYAACAAPSVTLYNSANSPLCAAVSGRCCTTLPSVAVEFTNPPAPAVAVAVAVAASLLVVDEESSLSPSPPELPKTPGGGGQKGQSGSQKRRPGHVVSKE